MTNTDAFLSMLPSEVILGKNADALFVVRSDVNDRVVVSKWSEFEADNRVVSRVVLPFFSSEWLP